MLTLDIHRFIAACNVILSIGASADFIRAGSGLTIDDGTRNLLEMPPQGNLSCHECYLSVDGEICLTLNNVELVKKQRCNIYEHYCQVEKYMTDNQVTTFTRKCSETCTPGCISAGKNFKVEYCYSCCQANFCNEDNGGSIRVTAGSFAPLLLFTLTSFIS